MTKGYQRKGVRERLGIAKHGLGIAKGAPSSKREGVASTTSEFSRKTRSLLRKGRLNAREVGDVAHSVDPSSRLARAKGKRRPKNQAAHSARSLARTYKSSGSFSLYPVYVAQVPQWDRKLVCKKDMPLAFLPPLRDFARSRWYAPDFGLH